ncbi:MAG: hypothetical protein QOG10_2775 [Kribbellaceae bacterium]|nr:hypothetical protein [Kribbellaceae bacterium]
MTTTAPAAEEGTGPRAAGRLAALQAIEQNSVRLNLPCVGTVTLPPPQHLAFYGGIAAVAALGFLEWPVAAVLAAGHLLAEDHHHRLIHDFGEALEEA